MIRRTAIIEPERAYASARLCWRGCCECFPPVVDGLADTKERDESGSGGIGPPEGRDSVEDERDEDACRQAAIEECHRSLGFERRTRDSASRTPLESRKHE